MNAYFLDDGFRQCLSHTRRRVLECSMESGREAAREDNFQMPIIQSSWVTTIKKGTSNINTKDQFSPLEEEYLIYSVCERNWEITTINVLMEREMLRL